MRHQIDRAAAETIPLDTNGDGEVDAALIDVDCD